METFNMNGKELREALFVLDNISTQEIIEENFLKREHEPFEKMTEEKLQMLLDEI